MSDSVPAHQALGLIALEISGLKASEFATFLQGGVETERLLNHPDFPPQLARLQDRLKTPGAVARANAEILRLEKLGIRLAVIGSDDYPPTLMQLYEPPLALFYRGENCALLREKTCVSIVGARKADQIACDVACDFALQVAQGGGCVVSGLAYGIDAHAHLGALQTDAAGPTVAVLGNGLEFGIYPSVHTPLAHHILDSGGLLLSQFPTQSKPFPSNFLDRNRVIAALSKATLIIQAAERSGALATARHALELGREVLVVPGAIGDARYVGSNRLIKQGAYLVSEIGDLFALVPDLTPPGDRGRNAPSINLSDLQLKIQKQLAMTDATHYDELLRSHTDAGALAEAIEGLEELKMVTRLPGNFIAARIKI